MRVSSRLLVAVAILAFASALPAAAETAPAEPAPVLDVGITAGRCFENRVELLGRKDGDSVCVSVSVDEPGGHAPYFQPVAFVLDPDGANRTTRESAGLTFRISASSSSKSRLVHAEVVVARGKTVLSRFHSVAALPSPAPSTP